MSNSRLDGVRKGTRIPDLLLRRQSLYPTELYGPIVLKPAISRGLTPYIVFLGLDNILSEEGIIHGLLLSIYCRVRSHFSRRIELTTELLFFSRLVLALFLRRRSLYTTELRRHIPMCIVPTCRRFVNENPRKSCQTVGLSMMCYTMGKEKRTALGDLVTSLQNAHFY